MSSLSEDEIMVEDILKLYYTHCPTKLVDITLHSLLGELAPAKLLKLLDQVEEELRTPDNITRRSLAECYLFIKCNDLHMAISTLLSMNSLTFLNIFPSTRFNRLMNQPSYSGINLIAY
jgi:hypothetical protein